MLLNGLGVRSDGVARMTRRMVRESHFLGHTDERHAGTEFQNCSSSRTPERSLLFSYNLTVCFFTSIFHLSLVLCYRIRHGGVPYPRRRSLSSPSVQGRGEAHNHHRRKYLGRNSRIRCTGGGGQGHSVGEGWCRRILRRVAMASQTGSAHSP